MPNLDLTESRHLSTQLIAFLVGNFPVTEFEAWVHQTPELRTVLNQPDYDELLTIRAEHPNAHLAYESILNPYIDWAQYEKEQLAELLMAIIWEDNAPAAMNRLRELFLKGYDFLAVLVTQHSHQLVATTSTKTRTPAQQEALMANLYPKLRAEANRVLVQLVAGKICFTGTYSSEGCPDYIEQ